ncbi:uncharacterized protein LOC128531782 [Clarias gariepinus]|uniref:uncharacterized protein LOC128531782 n=1 Tax=Clarias gariepinus TaxID=13013 RepID=UPI00234CC437|nr:uncharacterized protein LOC128531782 [Clarias gariepinus]
MVVDDVTQGGSARVEGQAAAGVVTVEKPGVESGAARDLDTIYTCYVAQKHRRKTHTHTVSNMLRVVKTPAQSMDFPEIAFVSVKSGESVSLNCPFGKINSLDRVIWYKQILGELPHKVGEKRTYGEIQISPEFETLGYKMETTDKAISLTIPHVKRDDGGLYYCETLSWENINLSNGTFLAVTGERELNISVFQSSVLDSVPAGASVTLQCSVLSESRAAELQVLWFRAASPQSHPQIIYTHHNSSHQCESGSSTHTCVYNFSKNILSLNDTGTYYCAVAACGKIIFGNGTRVQFEKVLEFG